MEQLSFLKEPIMDFETQQEFQECIEEWKKILFLSDWTIKGTLVEPPLTDDNGNELQGQNSFQISNKCATIRLVKPDEDCKSRIVKFCAECVVVHELLHCKYNWVSRDTNSLEYCYYEELEHSLIEQMAKSLIMAKYDLSFEWFKNF